MKIQAGKIEAFIKRPELLANNPSYIGALIYGPDIGLVSQRAEALAKLVVEDLSDPFRTADLSPEQLKDDPALLSDEMNAISFGGGKRLIRVRSADKTVLPAFKSAIANIADGIDAFILVTAGDLSPSAFRKFFESADNFAAIPCYQDDSVSLRQIIITYFNNNKLSYDRDVVTLLSEYCRGDRLVVVGELEKLSLYIGDESRVTIEDALTCIGDTTESSFDDICDAIANGDQEKLEHHLRKAITGGAMPVAILRVAGRYFSRLQATMNLIDRGSNPDQAISSLRPPVFFKRKAVFKHHLSGWSMKALWKVMELLYQGELDCKKTGSYTELICSRTLMKVASLSRL